MSKRKLQVDEHLNQKKKSKDGEIREVVEETLTAELASSPVSVPRRLTVQLDRKSSNPRDINRRAGWCAPSSETESSFLQRGVSMLYELEVDESEHLRDGTLEAIALQDSVMRTAEVKVGAHFTVCTLLYILLHWSIIKPFLKNEFVVCPTHLLGWNDNETRVAPNPTGYLEWRTRATCSEVEEASDKQGALAQLWGLAHSLPAHPCFSLGWYLILFAAAGLLLWVLICVERWLPRTFMFEHACESMFHECALGEDILVADRLEASLLLLYDKINTYSPRHVVPPNHDEIVKLLDLFDDNHNGSLSLEEWHDFCVFVFFQVMNDVCLVLLIDLIVSPFYATLIAEALRRITGVSSIPVAILVPLCIQRLRSSILVTGLVAPKRRDQLPPTPR